MKNSILFIFLVARITRKKRDDTASSKNLIGIVDAILQRPNGKPGRLYGEKVYLELKLIISNS